MNEATKYGAVKQWLRIGMINLIVFSVGPAIAEHKNIVPIGPEVTDLFVDKSSRNDATTTRAVLLRHLQETVSIVNSYEQANRAGHPESVQPLLQSKRHELVGLRQTLSAQGSVSSNGNKKNAVKTGGESIASSLNERLDRLDNVLAGLQNAKTDGERNAALTATKSLLTSYRAHIAEPSTILPNSPGWSNQPIPATREKPTQQKPAYISRGFKSAGLFTPWQVPIDAIETKNNSFTFAREFNGA